MTTNDRPTNEQTPEQRPGYISAECRDGQHGYRCSRNPHSPLASMGGPVCECACHDARRQVRWCPPETPEPTSETPESEGGMMTIPCPHCQQPMLLVSCDYCDAQGGWWAMGQDNDDGEWFWRVCPDCHDTGQRWICLNTFGCPGKVWYPLDACSAACVASVAAAQSGKGSA